MVVKILLWAGFSIASGVLYRLGGKGGFRHAKGLRRFGCSLLFLSLFIALRGSQGLNLRAILPYMATYALSALALSTYHDYCGFDNFWLTGFVYGLAALPLAWVGVHIWVIIVRAILLAISIGWLRARTGKVFIEELGSGFLYLVSLPILLL